MIFVFVAPAKNISIVMADWNKPPVKVAVGIIKKANKILVCQRPPDKPYSGYWEFPGGKIEQNESGERALHRELQEELGIAVVSAKPWFNHAHTYPDKKVALEMWLIEDFTGEPKGLENQVIQWATFQELMQLRLLEGNWVIMERIRELFT